MFRCLSDAAGDVGCCWVVHLLMWRPTRALKLRILCVRFIRNIDSTMIRWLHGNLQVVGSNHASICIGGISFPRESPLGRMSQVWPTPRLNNSTSQQQQHYKIYWSVNILILWRRTRGCKYSGFTQDFIVQIKLATHLDTLSHNYNYLRDWPWHFVT